jgi:hypothetical protein
MVSSLKNMIPTTQAKNWVTKPERLYSRLNAIEKKSQGPSSITQALDMSLNLPCLNRSSTSKDLVHHFKSGNQDAAGFK